MHPSNAKRWTVDFVAESFIARASLSSTKIVAG